MPRSTLKQTKTTTKIIEAANLLIPPITVGLGVVGLVGVFVGALVGAAVK